MCTNDQYVVKLMGSGRLTLRNIKYVRSVAGRMDNVPHFVPGVMRSDLGDNQPGHILPEQDDKYL